MTSYKRVAIFFAPKSKSPLAEFGAQWLSWDVEEAIEVPHTAVDNLPLPIPELVATPQKYGFHGTLKAPFRLSENTSLKDLRAAMDEFTKTLPAFTIGDMHVARLGQFVAIIPKQASEKFSDFASKIVMHFDEHRAPLNDKEIARRRQANLTPRQDEQMLKWGYPYIFDDFRFHLTLTGKLSEADAEMVKETLIEHLADILSAPIKIVDLCLYGEREDGRFEIIERFPLQG